MFYKIHFMKSLIKAAITLAATLFALVFASAQTTVNAVNVTSKCENCPPHASSVSYNGNVDANHNYPNHVEITNTATMSTDGTRFVKFKQFGYVINYPKHTVQLYLIKGKRREDSKIGPVTLHPQMSGAKQYHERFYIQGVGECRIYFDAKTHNVVGAVLEHWEFPDASGQFVTHEGLTTNF